MSRLFWMLLRKELADLVAAVLLFTSCAYVIARVFQLQGDKLAGAIFVSYIVSLLAYLFRTKTYHLHLSDQWPLLLPVSRRRLVFFNTAFSLAGWLIFLAHALACLLIYLFAFSPEALVLSAPTAATVAEWERAQAAIFKAVHRVVTVQYPAEISFAAVAIAFGALLAIVGPAKLLELQMRAHRPIAAPSRLTLKERLKQAAWLAIFLAFAYAMLRAPELLPWFGFAALVFLAPQALATTFALSPRQARAFAFALVQAPVLAFALYFAGGLEWQRASRDEVKREIASVYLHSLAGQTLMPERRKLLLAAPGTGEKLIKELRREHFEAYGSWRFGRGFPVSFKEAVGTKTDPQAVEAVVEAFDPLELTDADAAAYIRRLAELKATIRQAGSFHDWERFPPSEAFTLELLDSPEPLLRSFGIYLAGSAAVSKKIQARLASLAKHPGLQNEDLAHLSFALSMQLRRQVTIAAALRLDPRRLPAPVAREPDCESFRGRKWTDIAQDAAIEPFVNVCLRGHERTRPLSPADRYRPSYLRREWVDASAAAASPPFTAYAKWRDAGPSP